MSDSEIRIADYQYWLTVKSQHEQHMAYIDEQLRQKRAAMTEDEIRFAEQTLGPRTAGSA